MRQTNIANIKNNYGSVNSTTTAQFAEEIGIQPSDRLIEIMDDLQVAEAC